MDLENIVYVIDPDEEMSRSMAALIGTYGIRVKRFVDAESFLLAAKPLPTNNSCLLVELDLPGAKGMSLLRQLHDKYENLPIIAMGEGVPSDMAEQARGAGATDFIERSLVGAYLFHRLATLMPGADNLPPHRAVHYGNGGWQANHFSYDAPRGCRSSTGFCDRALRQVQIHALFFGPE